MTPLQAFFAEMKAAPKAQKALAEDAMIEGQPVAEMFDWWERIFDRLDTGTDDTAVKLHDEAVRIVGRKSMNLRERILALVVMLEPYDPERRKQ
jgi:hypothetical protein